MQEVHHIFSGPFLNRVLSYISLHRAAIFFSSLIVLILGIWSYMMIYVAIPADRANRLKKEQAAQAKIKGEEVFVEMLEEMKKLREAIEMIANKF